MRPMAVSYNQNREGRLSLSQSFARSTYALIIVVLAVYATPAPSSAAESPCPSVLDHKLVNLQDEPVSLCQYSGKVLLIVNTASECGYTPQYEGLEKLYRRYRDKGFTVLGFPANDFGAQEPGTEKEIESFCEINYGVTFPMFAKIDVNGKSYLVETALRADFALVSAFLADYLGNLSYALTARNFNPVMAMAGETTIVTAEHIVPVGVIAPDHVITPAPLVDYLVVNG